MTTKPMRHYRKKDIGSHEMYYTLFIRTYFLVFLLIYLYNYIFTKYYTYLLVVNVESLGIINFFQYCNRNVCFENINTFVR